MFTDLQCRILHRIAPRVPDRPGGCPVEGNSHLSALMGDDFFPRLAGKVVVDFGCGEGADAVEMALRGAARVIGIDIREDVLLAARQLALRKGVADTCLFASSCDELADIVVSVDAFEHFADPAGILRVMSALLRPAGEVFVSFGPTWYHPLGGHLFSVFP